MYPGLGQAAPDPPEERMAALLGRRRLERGDDDALRIHLADHVLDRSALPGRVEALEDEQDAAPVARPPVRIEPLLKIGELVGQLGLVLLRGGLAAGGLRRRAGVKRSQVDPVGGHPQGGGERRHGGPRLYARRWRSACRWRRWRRLLR
jgi:hypothetical protein